MANDPRDLDGSKIRQALFLLGRNTQLREELIDWLRKVEKSIEYPGSIRDDITGPLVDALHTDDDSYDKVLADGTRFRFLFRTKIARDFLLAERKHPTHVWEPQTTRLLQHLVAATNGDVLIGGAYFGDHAIILGRQLLGSGRLVHCFEPNLDQAALLAENMNINVLDDLRIQKLGLWNESSKRLRLDGFDSFANVVESDTAEGGFETISIDDYSKAQSCAISVLMLDIEGAELRALQGATDILHRDRPAVVFEVHRDYVDWSDGLLSTPVCSLLVAAGYRLFALRDFNTNQEMGDRCIELIPAETVYLDGPPHGFNMLAVADENLIASSLFRQVSHVSPKLLRHKSPDLHWPRDGMPDIADSGE